MNTESHNLASLKKWADKSLDLDILKGRCPEEGTAASQTEAILKEREYYLLEHKGEEMLIIESGGAEFTVYAPYAMQTSQLMTDRVAARHALNMRPGNRFLFDWNDANPYVVDRIVDWYNTGTLDIRETKKLESAILQPQESWEQKYVDQTDTLSTLEAYLLIYSKAIRLQNSALQQAVEVQLREYLTSPSIGYVELLKSLELLYREYGAPAFRDPEKILKRMLLSALVRNNTAMLLSDEMDECMSILRSTPTIFQDHAMGMAFYNEVFMRRERDSRAGDDAQMIL